MESSWTEGQLDADAIGWLARRGYPVVTLDTTDKTPNAVADVIAEGIAQGMALPPSRSVSA